MTFDEKKFKQGWRRLCQEKDIDPATGKKQTEEMAVGSLYQRCNTKAERRKAVQRAVPDQDWWKRADLWAERDGYAAGCDRPISDEVFDGLWLETRRYAPDLSALEIGDIVFGPEFTSDVLKEALRELRNEMDGGPNDQVSLKKIHQRQAAREERVKTPKRTKRPPKMGKLDFSGMGLRLE